MNEKIRREAASGGEAPRYIAIEGVIGVGKTTLATLLAARLNRRLVLEQFEENPFLPEFYRDPERYAFQTQIFFLLSRYRQQQELSQLDLFYEGIVSDYIFDKDRIFASLTLADHELALYESVVNALEGNIPAPDLVVYLQSSPERVMGNIRSRGRAMELEISPAYLADLADAYAVYFSHYTAAPVLIVNTGRIDLLTDRTSFERLVGEILRPCDAGTRQIHLI